MNMMNNVIMIVNLRPSAQKNLMARLYFVTLVKSVLQLYKVTICWRSATGWCLSHACRSDGKSATVRHDAIIVNENDAISKFCLSSF